MIGNSVPAVDFVVRLWIIHLTFHYFDSVPILQARKPLPFGGTQFIREHRTEEVTDSSSHLGRMAYFSFLMIFNPGRSGIQLLQAMV